MTITVTISNLRELAGATAAAKQADDAARATYISAHPDDPQATGYTPIAPQSYLQTVLSSACQSYRDSLAPDRITGSEFVLRLTPDELKAIVEAGKADPIAKGFYDRVTSLAYVWLAADETQQGIGYCVMRGWLHPERAAEILAY